VTTAIHGKEAVQKVSEEDFDLILMDLNMPILDGFQATKLIRDKGCRAIIIALSASS